MKRRRCLDYISTTTLRAMAIALAKPPWARLLRGYRLDIDRELLARDLEAIAEQSGGYACIAPEGVQ